MKPLKRACVNLIGPDGRLTQAGRDFRQIVNYLMSDKYPHVSAKIPTEMIMADILQLAVWEVNSRTAEVEAAPHEGILPPPISNGLSGDEE